jgi:hypothetical protein
MTRSGCSTPGWMHRSARRDPRVPPARQLLNPVSFDDRPLQQPAGPRAVGVERRPRGTMPLQVAYLREGRGADDFAKPYCVGSAAPPLRRFAISARAFVPRFTAASIPRSPIESFGGIAPSWRARLPVS